MGAQTKRNRDANGTIQQLDLTAAAAASRRLDVDPSTSGAKSIRLLGFSWKKTAGVAVDITISRVDKNNGNAETILETLLGDVGATGAWRPQSEEVAGYDPTRPDADSGTVFRLQFSQAGGACVCDPVADYKEV